MQYINKCVKISVIDVTFTYKVHTLNIITITEEQQK